MQGMQGSKQSTLILGSSASFHQLTLGQDPAAQEEHEQEEEPGRGGGNDQGPGHGRVEPEQADGKLHTPTTAQLAAMRCVHGIQSCPAAGTACCNIYAWL